MNKLETREQAEARAMELFPRVKHNSIKNIEAEVQRQAFIQCWDEMQRHQNEERLKDIPKKYRDMPVEVVNKQTCGFCVEPASKTIKEAFDNIPKEVRDRHVKVAYEEHKQIRKAAEMSLETMNILLNELPKDDVVLIHEVASRKKQLEKALNQKK